MRDKKIIKSSVIIIMLTILGKGMAFFRDALIASKFGATRITDIYMFSLGVVMLLTTIGYGLTTTLIPMHTENIEKKNIQERNVFISNLLNTSGFITIIFIFISIFISPWVVKVFAPGFMKDMEVFQQAVHILRIMFVSLIFVSMQSIVTGVLQAHKEFSEPAAMAFVQNIIMVVYLIILSNVYGMNGFAVATVTGFVAQFLINVPKFKKLGYSYVFTIDFKDKDILKLLKLMLPIIISTSIIQINLFITRYFATNLYDGAVSALDFSNKLNMLIYEVFAVAISMVVYPTLATYAAQKNSVEYKNALIKAFNVILLIMVPASIGVLILREPIVSVIFERGAFDKEAVKLTATALMFYTPAMIAYGVRDILYKAFYSIKDTRVPMVNSILAILLNIILSFVLVKNMEVSGLALASSISTVITTLILIFILNNRLKGINLKYLIKSFLKIVISSLVMGGVIINIRNLCFLKLGINSLGNIVTIIISFVVGVIVYFVCVYLLKVEEYIYMVELVREKIGKNKS
ncbi:murein biosynthesis integral membrane protein MurJ [Clostridium sp. MB40-C1]|uniref:murein biosynthesis integral membrane protein MurJ n=1 Tax=Clostridium sp. MB40-C1 TaxID=3070996 RepID=UPI0027E1C793|nr:murein biosynthesis integral membrane protein MurJ [Clostridium sp. MB40-C1]WMJ81196.1 murein biosynthesis integral membrane protein MurJ [Clostridium sp. MB40-C1]